MPRPLILLRALAFLPWLGFMMYTSHTLPPLGQEELGRFAGWRLDLGVHFGEYLLLGFLLSMVVVLVVRKRWWLVVLGLCAALAVIDEWTQALVPHRVPDVQDGLADLAGAVAAVLVWSWVNRRVRRRRESFQGPGSP